jgi:ferredoxin
MVTISVDRDKCMGHARCAALAPEVYQLDDDGYVDVPSATVVADELRGTAQDGASACPERAINLSHD